MPLFAEFQAALERCMAAEPPTGETDPGLSPDAGQLAGIIAEMRQTQAHERPLAALTEAQRTVFARWHVEETERKNDAVNDPYRYLGAIIWPLPGDEMDAKPQGEPQRQADSPPKDGGGEGG